MSKGLLFWVLMILWLIFGLWTSWPLGVAFGVNILEFILFALLGWATFGRPIQ